MRISDWSSDVCSSDLADPAVARRSHQAVIDAAGALAALQVVDAAEILAAQQPGQTQPGAGLPQLRPAVGPDRIDAAAGARQLDIGCGGKQTEDRKSVV